MLFKIRREGNIKKDAEAIRNELYSLLEDENAILHRGKILELSKELDKLIVEQQLHLKLEE